MGKMSQLDSILREYALDDDEYKDLKVITSLMLKHGEKFQWLLCHCDSAISDLQGVSLFGGDNE
mgnify:CR=1 FL=1